MVLTLSGILAVLLVHYTYRLGFGSDATKFGLTLALTMPDGTDLSLLLAIGIVGLVAETLTAIQVYRKSLADGLSQGL